MRRLAPVTLIALGVLGLLTWYVIYTRGVVRELRQEASRVGLMYARVYNGLSDPNPDAANSALLDLSRHIRESGLPMILADPQGIHRHREHPVHRAAAFARHAQLHPRA